MKDRKGGKNMRIILISIRKTQTPNYKGLCFIFEKLYPIPKLTYFKIIV